MSKKKIVVVCPGRGSYTAETLGYLKKYNNANNSFLNDINQRRKSFGDPTISELDNAEKFSPSLHTKGEHASTLIYACSFYDFEAIDREQYDIVAVLGNSMGWYLTLAYAGSLDWGGAFHLIQTMGGMMRTGIVGGQLIYPIVGEDWRIDPEREKIISDTLLKLRRENIGEAYISIHLGGYAVIGGDKPALDYLQKNLPKSGDYPFQLINHAAFHTPLLFEASKKGFEMIDSELFHRPKIPMIDGRGVIWQPYSTNVRALYEYTLGHQVYAPYDFTASVTVALKEFLPDHLVLLGPGSSLGGSIGQILIKNNWRGMKNKEDFQRLQKAEPFLISMGMAAQRELVVRT